MTPGLIHSDEKTCLLTSMNKVHCEILGSHNGEYEDDIFLGCCTVLSGRSLPMFLRCLLPPSSSSSL
jgi:hypothetical protein